MDHKSKGVAIIAVGGGASNMLNTIVEKYPGMTATMVVNSDQVGINSSKATNKIMMKGLVASELDRLQDQVESFIHHKDGVILLACLGGLTGSNLTAPIAKTAKKLEIPTLAIVSLPFDFEGKSRMEKALKGKERIEALGITVASYSNQKLLDMAGKETSLEDAFKLVDKEVLHVLSPYLTGKKVIV